MNLVQNFFYLFSHYADPTERMVGKFFLRLNEKNINYDSFDKLIELTQNNLVMVSLWNERNFKGYEYLTKAKRKELYGNVDFILSDFDIFLSNDLGFNVDVVLKKISKLGVDTSKIKENKEKLKYLDQIMRYLSPSAGRYAYRPSSTFGELLKDPSKDVIQGDCNQIVTLYIYLYSKKFSVKDLQLKTRPGHVMLHYSGVDIEATNGKFVNYQKDDQKILPIQEIISINLLDVTDSYFKTHKIPPESFLQSARLAYLVSGEKEIINNNMYAAYNNVINEKMSKNDYRAALKFAKQSNKQQLINIVGYNGAAYYLNNEKFAEARKFASYSANEKEFMKKINYSQAINLYNKNDYRSAMRIFKNINESDMVKKCYEGLFVLEQKNLGKIQTTDDMKQNRSTIHRLQDYAKKSGNQKLIDHALKLSKYL